MKKFNYFPLIKTRDAEFKAMSKLEPQVFDKILPIYELTKSRKTKIAPDGDIHRRMANIKEIQCNRPFILDLSTNEKYSNAQIEQLGNPKNGYYEWQYFLNIYSDLKIIPMIHLYDEEDFSEVVNFVNAMKLKVNNFAVRLPVGLDDYKKYIRPIVTSLNEDNKVFIIFDGEQINPKELERLTDEFRFACQEVDEFNLKIEDIIIISTSFPSSVKSFGDSEGVIPILEEDIFMALCEEYPVSYGDYASINIEQIEIRGGTFIPRIDVPLDNDFIYKRCRRESGSYELCAKKILEDTRYHSLGIWPNKEIAAAAKGNPSGISPSFWIAIRMNYFMTSRVNLRSS